MRWPSDQQTSLLFYLRSASDVLKAIRETKDANLVMGKVFDLSREILDAQHGAITAQAAQAETLAKMRELEAKLAAFENWENEVRRYKLTDFGGETFAYLLRPEMSDGEPSHRLCPACFQKKGKSILQFRHKSFGQGIYGCPSCKADFRFGIETDAGDAVAVPTGWDGLGG